jgi:hypothetical protein
MKIIPKYTIDNPPSSFEKRVFIGGNFRIVSLLEEIYKKVIDCDFQPIFSLDFGIPWEETRHYSGRLVQISKYAIFETSLENGYYFEMEDAKNYGSTTLCVWDGHQGDQPRISTMALTSDVFKKNSKSYSCVDELKLLVENFLR